MEKKKATKTSRWKIGACEKSYAKPLLNHLTISFLYIIIHNFFNFRKVFFNILYVETPSILSFKSKKSKKKSFQFFLA